MKTLSKSIGIMAIAGTLLLGGISFPHETHAQPKCLVKGSTNIASGKFSKDFKFNATNSFAPKLDITLYGDAKGAYIPSVENKEGLIVAGGKGDYYSTKKQTKTLVLSSKKIGKGQYTLYFSNGGKKTLHITSFCLHN
ncbi:hypothetical protein MK805_06845 [Shimazuella sp. AN120528]|uniref:hypothetical protein n=1 Tax=Shimazuella soli TaxID=1892854 RepID=UPI001F111A74|nr:hypothetical protein [Shimazuella soli]MCH5584687.1 hypothetical protein [Shimazuella soli]